MEVACDRERRSVEAERREVAQTRGQEVLERALGDFLLIGAHRGHALGAAVGVDGHGRGGA
jgi:hypothetical protein